MSSDRESFTFRVGISLVIHNRLEEVKKTLDSLSHAITDIDRVCLVDNASSNREDLDGLKKSQQFHWMENSENRGYAAAHHQALNWLMEQNCQYCLLLNPDLALPKTILDDLSHASR
ncbi:MAG: glycosyltransferase, partial [SAR324 cluster bacterium]|nr:glycosyltransferase [SAR324 cluster bacterium]